MTITIDRRDDVLAQRLSNAGLAGMAGGSR